MTDIAALIEEAENADLDNDGYLYRVHPGLILRLTAALREREWRPIESAPRDGRRVLFFDGSTVAVALCDPITGVWWWDDDDRVRGAHDLFHWMPLPEPPE